ncbi:MAG: NADH-quinone oxidoreductase subunit L [Legionellales bacterium]|nr:NADH-quinone oxidoreductase subunit L [Legionellales bacterium]
MSTLLLKLLLILPLLSSVQAMVMQPIVTHTTTHRICISLMGLTCVIAFTLTAMLLNMDQTHMEATVFYWLDNVPIRVYVDVLTATMLCVVSFVSLLVHIYSVGYMKDDLGYQRFFSLVSLFTFMMLTLVCADNFLQLFFGWEGVGVVSYLLIGFWHQKDSAANASLKAFLVNRLGDFGLICGTAIIVSHSGDLNFNSINQALPLIEQHSSWILFGQQIPGIELVAFCMFMGAMAKSAQIPLHVWLPDSMEGPTPISALIHAATMVTAGIYMIARLSILFESAPHVQSIILILGSVGALSLGLVAVVQTDIKRVVAYSTLSQLGYMAAATGVSAYDLAIFHLTTHAAFKALLFLGCGSVIIALHHEQNIEKMGGLATRLPITYVCFLIGSLSLVALPPLSGFFSKDLILMAVAHSHAPLASSASWLLSTSAVVTALYSFRLLALVFHGHNSSHTHTIKEPGLMVTLPLIILAVPSVALGYWLNRMDFLGQLNAVIFLTPSHLQARQQFLADFREPSQVLLHAFEGPILWLVIITASLTVIRYHQGSRIIPTNSRLIAMIYMVLVNKFGFDRLYQSLTATVLCLARCASRLLDQLLIDRIAVESISRLLREQSKSTSSQLSGQLFDYLRYTIYLVSSAILVMFLIRVLLF